MERIRPNTTLMELLSLGVEEAVPAGSEDLKEVVEDYVEIMELGKLFLFSRYPLRRLLAKRDMVYMLNSLTLIGEIVVSEEDESKAVYFDDENYQIRILIRIYPKDLRLVEPTPCDKEKKRWLSD